MNTHVIRAMRVMAPNDVRLIWRDGFFLSFIVLVTPLASLGLHWLIPFVGDLVAQWVELEPYYGLILGNVVVAGQPVLLGFVIGVLFIEERDEGTLLALQASPLSLRSFLGYRLVMAMVLNVLLTMIAVLLANLVSISWLELLASATLASLAVPIVALVYVVYIKNKVQALMILKPVQIWGGAARPALFRAYALGVDRKCSRTTLLPHASVLERHPGSNGVVVDGAGPDHSGGDGTLAAAAFRADGLCLRRRFISEQRNAKFRGSSVLDEKAAEILREIANSTRSSSAEAMLSSRPRNSISRRDSNSAPLKGRSLRTMKSTFQPESGSIALNIPLAA